MTCRDSLPRDALGDRSNDYGTLENKNCIGDVNICRMPCLQILFVLLFSGVWNLLQLEYGFFLSIRY